MDNFKHFWICEFYDIKFFKHRFIINFSHVVFLLLISLKSFATSIHISLLAYGFLAAFLSFQITTEYTNISSAHEKIFIIE